MTAPVTPVPTILTIGAHNVYYVKLRIVPNNFIFDSGLLTNQHGTYL